MSAQIHFAVGRRLTYPCGAGKSGTTWITATRNPAGVTCLSCMRSAAYRQATAFTVEAP